MLNDNPDDTVYSIALELQVNKGTENCQEGWSGTICARQNQTEAHLA